MSDLTNFYNEIVSLCNPSDIDYVVTTKHRWDADPQYFLIDTEWFLEQAKRIEYDAGYGGNVIALGLKIVFKDGSWLERDEYDGSESWTHKGKPQKPKEMADKDVAIILDSRHQCPYNDTKIDGQTIRKTNLGAGNSYSIWLEKDGKIVIEEHEWQDGHYKDIHKDLLT